MVVGAPECLRRCRSRSPFKYSSVQIFHITSLQRLRYLARFRKSGFLNDDTPAQAMDWVVRRAMNLLLVLEDEGRPQHKGT